MPLDHQSARVQPPLRPWWHLEACARDAALEPPRSTPHPRVPRKTRLRASADPGARAANIDIKQVLLALQLFLDEATSLAAGREESYRLYQTNRAEYERRVKRQVQLAEKIPGTEGQ